MNLNKYVDQIKRFFKNSKYEGSKCEQLLGTNTAVYKWAEFYKQEADNIALVNAYNLYNFSLNEDYTKRDMEMYKKGLLEFGEFLVNCYEEREIAKEKKRLEEERVSSGA